MARGESDFWTITRVAGIVKISAMKDKIREIVSRENIDKGSDYFHKLACWSDTAIATQATTSRSPWRATSTRTA